MSDVSVWLAPSLIRVFPHTAAAKARELHLLAARNERVSFQACARNPGTAAVRVTAAVDAPEPLGVRIRRVGMVPVAHHATDTPLDEFDGLGAIPGYVPDPLFPDHEAQVGPQETVAFWITVTVPEAAQPGACELAVRLSVNQAAQPPLVVRLRVAPRVVQPRRDFPVTHWFYADALCDWYQVEPFEERFWQIVAPYLTDLVEHGTNCQHVPLFTPPTDGVKRPTQLLRVAEPRPGQYEFDFSDVRRFAALAQECGAQYFEWTHFFTQWGAKHAIRVYRDNADPDSLFWPPETAATAEPYRTFLAQFLPAFQRFLAAENLLDCSFFHTSDEPHGAEQLENYRKARALLAELAPWMRTMDALSELRFAQEGLVDVPIPSIATARQFVEAGIPSWAYFCCGPRGRFLNRLLDTPLPKIRMSGWLLYRLGARGFLHWGYNYWYQSQTQLLIDPFQEQSGRAWPGWQYGDPFVVYPGADGPLDSLRWEVFAESLQDYALLQSAGIAPDDPRLADIGGYDDFPKTAAWIDAARERIM